MTHRFTVFRRPEPAGRTAASDEWATDAIADATPDHFVPLLLTMGASTTTGRATTSGVAGRATPSGVDGTWFGNSIRSLQMVRPRRPAQGTR
jgi:4,5-DOPA dioxygenase extradiol